MAEEKKQPKKNGKKKPPYGTATEFAMPKISFSTFIMSLERVHSGQPGA
jgi:hypothetical protein